MYTKLNYELSFKLERNNVSAIRFWLPDSLYNDQGLYDDIYVIVFFSAILMVIHREITQKIQLSIISLMQSVSIKKT